MKKLVVIEDDEELGLLLTESLQPYFQVIRVRTGEEGLRAYESEGPDMIILDLNLPDSDGMDLCRDLRKRDELIPIIITSSRKEEVDRVLGLELGADDYISKPFSVRELRSRVNSFFRRLGAMEATRTKDSTEGGITGQIPLTIDHGSRIVRVDDREIVLTQKEYELLMLFIKSPGKTFNRQEIIREIWGEEWSGTDRVMVHHIDRLRNKIEKDPLVPAYIQTIHGVGYRFNPS